MASQKDFGLRFIPIFDSGGGAPPASSEGNDGGDHAAPPIQFTWLVFTKGGATFQLLSGANSVGNIILNGAGWNLTTATMIRDGVLTDFPLYTKSSGATPPVGSAYAIDYLLAGVYTTGFALRI